MQSASQILLHLRDSPPSRLADLPNQFGGIYALQYPPGRIVQIGNTGHNESNPQSFYTRICDRHRTGSEDEDHKASAAFNVGRMYRHLERFRRTPSSRIRVQPLYGTVCGIEQTKRAADIAKGLRNEVISRLVYASWYRIDRDGTGAGHSSLINRLEAEIRDLYGAVNLPWYGSVTPEDEPYDVVNAVIADFKRQGKWGRRHIRGDEEALLETQRTIWLLVHGAR